MKSILIADNDPDIYKLLASILTEQGFATVWVRTAAEAYQYLADNSPSFLILDYSLPDRNGNELITDLSNGGIRVPPFIIATGQGDERFAIAMMKLGACDCLVKDAFFAERLPEIVKRIRIEEENELKLSETRRVLRSIEALLVALFRQSPLGIMVVDVTGKIHDVNPAFEKIWKTTNRQLAGSFNVFEDPFAVKSGLASYIRPAFGNKVCPSRDFVYEPAEYGRTGSRMVLRVVAFPVCEDDKLSNVVVMQEDITKLKQTEEQMYQLAFYDPLTGLPNRSLMIERLSQRLLFLQRYPGQNVLILLNIDRFKIINDARGNRIGDALLVAAGKRINSLMRDADTVSRMTADEFAILLPYEERNVDKISLNTLVVTERIREAFRVPFNVEGEAITVSSSLGIALLPLGSDDSPQAVLRRADTALHRAKEAGGNQYAFFETDMGESASERYLVERALHNAIEGDEMRLFLQPQVDSKGKRVGAEALIRWIHPERGLLLPAAFIPIAEQSDIIIEIGIWVLTQACRMLVDAALSGMDLRLSVNVSPRHFRKSNFATWLKNLIQRTGTDPARLTLEITEGLFIDDIHDVVDKMTELAAIGIQFSIDDFGTGYSSLAYIKRLPIHELKIDKSFIMDAPTDSNDAILVETMLAVASHMHLTVVAEGVETEAQAAFLNERAEVIHQGYLFGRPELAEKWLEKWK